MHQYATFSDRLTAHLGDIIIVNLIALPIAIVSYAALNYFSYHSLIKYNHLVLIIWCVYSSLLNSNFNEGTIGKRKMGLKVKNVDGSQISLVQSFSRFVIGFLVFGLFIGMIPMFFSKKNRGLHDLMFGTVVVYNTNKSRYS